MEYIYVLKKQRKRRKRMNKKINEAIINAIERLDNLDIASELAEREISRDSAVIRIAKEHNKKVHEALEIEKFKQKYRKKDSDLPEVLRMGN